MILLVSIIYIFAVILTQNAMDHVQRVEATATWTEPPAYIADLKKYYGSLPMSMFTLYKAITDGISWHVVVEPLDYTGAESVFIFVCYMTFCYFAVLNVIISVFCQSAHEFVSRDVDNLLHDQIVHQKITLKVLKSYSWPWIRIALAS